MQSLFDLSDRVAVVTGASSGLGSVMAMTLAKAGAKTVLVARRKDKLEQIVRSIQSTGGIAATAVMDLGDRNQLENEAKRIKDSFGDPDILINAAGINLRQTSAEISFETWDRQLNLHLAVPFFLSRMLAPAMMSKGWGRIINIASLQSVRAFSNSAPYGAAKGGIVQLTRAMALDWSPSGVNVNAIAPGFFPTELTAAVFANKELAQANAKQTMIGRNGVLEDIVGPTLFLASNASNYVTGQTLFVDGGFTAK